MLLLNGLAKESWKRGTKKISRCARNDSVGSGYPDDSVENGYTDDSVGNGYSVHHTKNVWEKRSSRIVIPSEVEGAFSLAARRRVSEKEKRETPYRGRAVLLLKGLAKEAGKGGRKRFLAALEMTVWGMDILMTAW